MPYILLGFICLDHAPSPVIFSLDLPHYVFISPLPPLPSIPSVLKSPISPLHSRRLLPMEEYHHTVFGRFNLDGTTPSESGHRNVTIRSGRYLNETMTVIMETLPGNEDSLTGVVYGELSFPPEGLPRIRPLPQNTDPQVGTSLPAKQSPIFSLTGRCCGRHWSSPAAYSMELQVDRQGTTVVMYVHACNLRPTLINAHDSHGTQGLPKSYMNAMIKVCCPSNLTVHLSICPKTGRCYLRLHGSRFKYASPGRP